MFDLFAALEASDEQLDFPILYGSAKEGWMAESPEGLLDPEMPLARRDAPLGGATCGNAGGLDQAIFGISFTT